MVVEGLIIGSWFATATIGKLADKVRSYIEEQSDYLTTSTEKDLNSLVEACNKIKATIDGADQSQIMNSALQKWILDLEEAAYDAEDVIDKYEYQKLEAKSNGTSKVSEVCKSAQASFKRIGYRDKKLNELLAVAKKFKEIVPEMGTLHQLVASEHNSKFEERERRPTTSAPTESRLLGRDNERANIIDLLLLETQNKNNINLVPIVGIGGMGKTSLAQWVYNDEIIKDHFDTRAWVYVSAKFNVKTIMTEIIESASIRKPSDFYNLQSLDSVREILERGLAGKRFLIVLDDVWHKVNYEWEILCSSLHCAKEGSRVVLTTRFQDIAVTLAQGTTMGMTRAVVLKGLAEEDYWNFFVQCVFGRDVNPMLHPRLEAIARKIAKRLGGLPLAGKAVGLVLWLNFEEKRWRNILKSNLLQVDQPEGRVMPVLRLSYEHLPLHLKRCFVYCSLFPKGYRFHKAALVRIWMAHGFIQSTSEIMEDVGQSYIDELVNRSFFEGKISDSVFVIHDLHHDLAQCLSNDEFLQLDDATEQLNIPERVRHLYICAENLKVVCNSKHLKKKLRTLVVHGPSDIEFSLDCLRELQALRVLILDDLRVKWSSDSISKMIHLRYLSVNKVRHDRLPDSLCNLYHMQVLDLEYSDKVPKEINRLINLRFLNANPDVVSNIAGIGELTCLQQLLNYHVRKQSMHSVSQLRKMNQLRILKISALDNAKGEKDASEAMLENKKHLDTLSLVWSTESRNSDEVLEALRPHPNLRKLTIRGYPGTRSPSWIDATCLENLDYICLFNCTQLEALPPLGRLPFLKVLELLDMGSVKKIGGEFYGSNSSSDTAFPRLERLVFDRMPEWQEWCGVDDGSHLFPRLSYLGVRDCPNLRGSLHLPPGLKKLDVRQSNKGLMTESSEVSLNISTSADILILTEWIPLQSLSTIETICISNDELTSFSSELEDWLQHLTSLKTLVFDDCPTLKSLPSQLNRLSVLEVLSIKGCHEMQSLPQERLPTSLKELNIQSGYELFDLCREGSPGWHKIAHIPVIRSGYNSTGGTFSALVPERRLPLTFSAIKQLAFTCLNVTTAGWLNFTTLSTWRVGMMITAILMITIISIGICYKTM